MTMLYRHEDLHCPACEKRLNGTAVLTGAEIPPSDGDVTVCTGCAGLLVFQLSPLGRGLRAMTADEQAAYAREDPAAWRAVQQLQAEVTGRYWHWRLPGAT
jgi:hypothetical protein